MVPENKFSAEQQGREPEPRDAQSGSPAIGNTNTGEQQQATPSKPKKARGLAAADPETRKQVARKGGEAVSRNRKHMADIGRKGGEAVSQDRKHMASIGRKGGEAVSQNREHMAEIGRKGGEARGTRGEDEFGAESESSGQGNAGSGQGGEGQGENS